ncbi:hypothetical protein GO986_05565 [Deinococcus sp. HMF7620]|uniref:Uncharacterized protein n=1 Tax=Deinococcus arboris TaxID=2682977 RepID=A0A7C9HXG5_9DEIO|nr:hypothetical protein [Deinococcus arboris]MVN86228.1 hypothetical protein [Deinococcus arboris]
MKKAVVLATLLLSSSAFASYQSWAGGAPKRTAAVQVDGVTRPSEAPDGATRPSDVSGAATEGAGRPSDLSPQGGINAI